MKRIVFFLFALLLTATTQGQNLLTLDSCRSMALANNKRLLIGEKEIEKAGYDNKAAKTTCLNLRQRLHIFATAVKHICLTIPHATN